MPTSTKRKLTESIPILEHTKEENETEKTEVGKVIKPSKRSKAKAGNDDPSLSISVIHMSPNKSEDSQQAIRLKQRVLKIQEILDHYYPNPPVPLDHVNDFTFLVAVVLSAQTTDGKVNEVTKELFKLADCPEKMVQLDIPTIQRIIQPVGLAPRKASYVYNLSKKLLEEYNSTVPNSFEALESLPGVGHKTASVIMSQLHGVNAFAVDTHVHRLALRWGLSKDERNVDKVQADLCKLFPEENWNKAHLQMIYFGREYCPAKNHVSSECPVCSWLHNDSKRPTSLEKLQSFSPTKKAKGLVYYNDRVEQLAVNPSLAKFSPPPPSPSHSKSCLSLTGIEVKVEGVDLERFHTLDVNLGRIEPSIHPAKLETNLLDELENDDPSGSSNPVN